MNTGEKFIVRNIMEEFVESKLDEYIKEAQVCGCPQCRADILAVALNNLPPRYVATSKGDLFVRVDAMSGQGQADIVAAIMQGIITVNKTPRHKIEK